jgi:aminoglycoside 6'-N-acetyltransferase
LTVYVDYDEYPPVLERFWITLQEVQADRAAGHPRSSARVSFRDFVTADLPVLADWLAEPHVARFWAEPFDVESVTARYQPCLDGRDLTYLAVLRVDGEDVGMFQCYRLADEPQWSAALRAVGITGTERAAGIDYLIGRPHHIGRGIGTAAINVFCKSVFSRYGDVERILVDVAQDNRASWRALERNGFRRIYTGAIDDPDGHDDGPQYVYELSRVSSASR